MKRQATTTQFFYQGGKLVTVNQGGQHRTILRSNDIPLAELSTGERQETGLLEVDQNGSVLKVSGDADEEEAHSYSAYGHDPSLPSQRTHCGFNGELVNALAAAYLLGNGYRLFNPVLMRFHSADSISPFDRGGLNAYAYCGGDPVNNTDPSGHQSLFKWLAGGYKTSRLTQRYEAVSSKLYVFAETKHRSLSKNEYTTLNRDVLDKINYLSKKVDKYTTINHQIYSSKTQPGNTSSEKIKSDLYQRHLSQMKAMQADLSKFKRIWPEGVTNKPRYMSQKNHERYRKLLLGEPAAAPRGSLITDPSDPEYKRQYLSGVPTSEIRRPYA